VDPALSPSLVLAVMGFELGLRLAKQEL
jgi:hypothetical protein